MIVRNQGEKWLARLDEQDQLPGLHHLVPHGGKEIDLVLGPVSGVVEVGQGKGGGAVAKSSARPNSTRSSGLSGTGPGFPHADRMAPMSAFRE